MYTLPAQGLEFTRTFLLRSLTAIFLEINMQRNYQSAYTGFQNNQELTTQTAFHEAGHASKRRKGSAEPFYSFIPFIFFLLYYVFIILFFQKLPH